MSSAPKDKPAIHPAPHDKIRTVEQLGEVARAAQAKGLTVALCHGVFDLVHLGHVRHILAARNEADVVIVTITADRFVNKGPGRPIFPENMRAEMLAALGTVDWVGINQTSSAEPVLDTVRPDIYVKGSDYENPEDDVTGKIAVEREAVERHGGRIVFTRDVTFSSSSLLNRYFDIYDPPLRDYLQKVREGGGGERLLKLIDKIQDMHVVLVGDTIIDEYQYVTALGKASKENIVATLLKNGEQFAGGVIAAANHVASFCKSVEIVTTLGGNDYPEEFIRAHVRPNVTLTPIRIQGRPTTRKLRYVEMGYLHKLFEVYTMDDTPLEENSRQEIDRVTAERVRGADVVIVTDFGHGMIASSTIDTLIENSKFLAVNAQSNSGNHGYNLITCIITEALHGAIVADLLRKPWKAVSSRLHINAYKWSDWCESVGIAYLPQPVDFVCSRGLRPCDRALNAVKRCVSALGLGKEKWRHKRVLHDGRREEDRLAGQILAVKQRADYVLSPAAIRDRMIEQTLEALTAFKQDVAA